MQEGHFESYLQTHDFSRFYSETRSGWSRLARKVLRLIDHPAHVDADDVMQVMLIAAVRFMDEWNPERGVALKTFVVWRAIDKAEKYLHAERGQAWLRAGPSKHEVAVGWFAENLQPAFCGSMPSVEARVELRDQLKRAGRFRLAVEEFARTGDLKETAAFLVARGRPFPRTKKRAEDLVRNELRKLMET